MLIIRSLTDLINLKLTQGTCLTLGNFDGLHLGHKLLINKVVAWAKENKMLSCVLTFAVNTNILLNSSDQNFTLICSKDKIKKFRALGVDILLILPFTIELSEKSAEEFALELFKKALHAKKIYVGYDFAFGYKRQGDAKFLQGFCAKQHILFEQIAPLQIQDLPISSSKIRELLKEGLVEQAALFLDYYYSLSGVVGEGRKKGRELGFPTANLKIPDNFIIKQGVYAAMVKYKHKFYPSVSNIGSNPTFAEQNKLKFSFETHLFEFNEDLYGKKIAVYFVKRIRSEQKFNNLNDLTAQIQKDIEDAKQILA